MNEADEPAMAQRTGFQRGVLRQALRRLGLGDESNGGRAERSTDHDARSVKEGKVQCVRRKKSSSSASDSSRGTEEVARVLEELRGANGCLVIAGIRVQELADQAETARHHAEAVPRSRKIGETWGTPVSGAPVHPDRFWQARFYDFNVWTERKRIEKLRYIHRNPVERELVSSPEQWRWSSFRWYLCVEVGQVRINDMDIMVMKIRPPAA